MPDIMMEGLHIRHIRHIGHMYGPHFRVKLHIRHIRHIGHMYGPHFRVKFADVGNHDIRRAESDGG